MLGLTKEKILVIAAILFAALMTWMLVFREGIIIEDWVLTQKPRTYYAPPPQESTRDTEASIARPERNPFVSLTRKLEYIIDLPLPDQIDKQFTPAILRPMPDEKFCANGLLKFPFDRSYPYDTSLKLPAPTRDTLPRIAALNTLITEVESQLHPITTGAITEPVPEDTLILKNSLKITGKYVTEDKDFYWFVPSGRNTVSSYKRQDVEDVERVYSVDELYEMELQKVITSDAYSWFRLAEWCFEKKLNKYGAEALKQALKINNRDLKFYLKLADYYISIFDFESEMALYQDALKSDLISKDPIYVRLAEANERYGLDKESIGYYEKALTVNSNNTIALLRLAHYYYRNRLEEAGKKKYDRLKNITLSDLSDLEGVAYLEYYRGDFAKAKKSLTDYSTKPGVSAQTWNILGMISMMETDYSTASEHFIKAIYNTPNLTTAWANLSALYLAANMPNEAEELLTEYIDLNPIDEISYVAQGYLQWRKSNLSAAMADFEQAITMTPNSFPAHYAKAQLHYYQKNYADARTELQWVLSNNSGNSETLACLAMACLYQKEYKESLKYFKAYLAQAPENIVCTTDLSNLALANIGVGDIDQSKQILAAEPLQNYVPALNILAFLEYRAKNVDGAIQRFKAVLELDPANPYARNSLDKILKAATQNVWLDNFERPDNTTIGRGWTESEKYGVEISINQNQCLFKGVQKLNETGLTYLEKAVSKQSFIRFEANLLMDSTNSAIGGIYLATAGKESGLYIACKNREILYGFSTKADAIPAEWLHSAVRTVPSDNFKLGVEAIYAKGRLTEFRLYIDDSLADVIPNKSSAFVSAKDSTFLAGVFSYAPLNQNWELRVTAVRLFEEKPK